ncbi:hypothetical protein [Streptomyces bambusae]|uniref:hypothetical protein n=1 Tax=Streptomyces bambusae TaxID=1550616 RepID=UPI0027E15BD9|nr:hypothetical protein [Streptomyces bambusae]
MTLPQRQRFYWAHEELDADPARQEAAIRERRQRPAALRQAGGDDAEAVPPAPAALIGRAPATDSPAAAKDREHLLLLDTRGAGGPELYEARRAGWCRWTGTGCWTWSSAAGPR